MQLSELSSFFHTFTLVYLCPSSSSLYCFRHGANRKVQWLVLTMRQPSSLLFFTWCLPLALISASTSFSFLTRLVVWNKKYLVWGYYYFLWHMMSRGVLRYGCGSLSALFLLFLHHLATQLFQLIGSSVTKKQLMNDDAFMLLMN